MSLLPIGRIKTRCCRSRLWKIRCFSQTRP
ncbi:hypothetical protein CGRA01v4_01376 [Colletotrichum graminicola]|nr:hypothetical protein CGRA01v4_01376 [Colletotrichum graminicola]